MRAAMVTWPECVAVAPWFLVLQTCFLDVWRLAEVHPVGFHPIGHTKDRTSGPLSPWW